MRHRIPVLVVISLNGGWTADAKHEKPGRDLGYTRFDKMAEALGCYVEYVERPEHIRGALERAGAGRRRHGGSRQRQDGRSRTGSNGRVRGIFDTGGVQYVRRCRALNGQGNVAR